MGGRAALAHARRLAHTRCASRAQDYNHANPYGNRSDSEAKFVGMDWCISTIDEPFPPNVNMSTYMGMNEPDNAHKCVRHASPRAHQQQQQQQQQQQRRTTPRDARSAPP